MATIRLRAVRTLLSAQGFQAVRSARDLAGIERISGGELPGARRT